MPLSGGGQVSHLGDCVKELADIVRNGTGASGIGPTYMFSELARIRTLDALIGAECSRLGIKYPDLPSDLRWNECSRFGFTRLPYSAHTRKSPDGFPGIAWLLMPTPN